MINKLDINEIIIVEGRDDTTAVEKAITGITIETHGFGIRKETWLLIEKAYNEKGIIIFTDPDFAGEEIRKRITSRFPDSKQAYLPQKKAIKGTDIGIENAKPEDIIEALKKTHYKKSEQVTIFTESDLAKYKLIGEANSSKNREKLGASLGIGYGNSKAFLKKLNAFNISREEFADKAKRI